MKKSQNGSRLEETSALLQQAMATLLQNQALFVARVEKLSDKMDQKFDKVDQRFAAIDKRLEHVESLLAKMFAELPEKVFGFAQAAKKESGSRLLHQRSRLHTAASSHENPPFCWLISVDRHSAQWRKSQGKRSSPSLPAPTNSAGACPLASKLLTRTHVHLLQR